MKQPATAPLRRPRPLQGDSSDVLAYLAALETYCTAIEAIGRTLQQQNRTFRQALEQIDRHVVGAYYADPEDTMAEPCEACGEMRAIAAQALKDEHP